MKDLKRLILTNLNRRLPEQQENDITRLSTLLDFGTKDAMSREQKVSEIRLLRLAYEPIL